MLASMPFTVTRDLILPSTVTGSWPRPRWFDTSMWGKPLDTCMPDVRFREKFEDALAVVISDEERAGLDILTHGDFHCDEDFAGRSTLWIIGSSLLFEAAVLGVAAWIFCRRDY